MVAMEAIAAAVSSLVHFSVFPATKKEIIATSHSLTGLPDDIDENDQKKSL